MKIVITIALNTFKETVRNKVLYNILLVAGVALFLSMSFGDLSVFSRGQVMTDFGLATMSLTGLLLAVFIGAGMLGAEISSKTAYGILTKPVSRGQFIFGKFLGLATTLMLNFVLVALVFFAAIVLMGAEIKPSIVNAILLLAVEMTLVVSAAIFFSSFTTPILAAIFTIGFYISGHLNDLFDIGIKQQESAVWQIVLKGFYYLLPNLEHFNIRSRVVYDLPVPSDFITGALCYGILYTVLLLVFASIVFFRKDL